MSLLVETIDHGDRRPALVPADRPHLLLHDDPENGTGNFSGRIVVAKLPGFTSYDLTKGAGNFWRTIYDDELQLG
ncbi:hypothetical protein KFK09_006018 [Dendrobium nobile]|uniref:Uncharacterized protein n=1 Tax=Dendrobium nobile TaxID=94219 RepID=A0A8T3BZW3_DENNO|nr:hypothetical protein KFK09_006018 [Dendrobium nobile]